MGAKITHAFDIPGSTAACCCAVRAAIQQGLAAQGNMNAGPQSCSHLNAICIQAILPRAKGTGEKRFLHAAQLHMHPCWRGRRLLLVSSEGC